MGVAQSQPVCRLNGWLYLTQDLGPSESGQAAQASDPPVWGRCGHSYWVRGHRPGLCPARPWPPHGDVRVSGGQRAVEGLPDLPPGRAPAFPGLGRVSAKSLASSSSFLAAPE